MWKASASYWCWDCACPLRRRWWLPCPGASSSATRYGSSVSFMPYPAFLYLLEMLPQLLHLPPLLLVSIVSETIQRLLQFPHRMRTGLLPLPVLLHLLQAGHFQPAVTGRHDLVQLPPVLLGSVAHRFRLVGVVRRQVLLWVLEQLRRLLQAPDVVRLGQEVPPFDLLGELFP